MEKTIDYETCFVEYIRAGQELSLEGKQIDNASGYSIPEKWADGIRNRLLLKSPIRSISNVKTIAPTVFKKPFSFHDGSNLKALEFPTMELYAMPAATSTLLGDEEIDLEPWIAEEVEGVFAEQESAAFVNGDGINKPVGFLNVPIIHNNGWTWGSLGYVATGSDGTLDPISGADVLVDTIYALKAGYRQNAHFVMNRKTQAELRKLKDEDGNYIWKAPTDTGMKATLMGFPVVESEDMPDISPDSTPIAFGDFRRGYLVVDRASIRVLRDPYSAKPYVLFYTTKRVGGGVQDFDAIKLIKFGCK